MRPRRCLYFEVWDCGRDMFEEMFEEHAWCVAAF